MERLVVPLSCTILFERQWAARRNGVSPDAADDMGDAPHRPNIYVTDVPRDNSVALEQWNARIVIRCKERTSPYLGQSKSIDIGLLIGNGVSPDAGRCALPPERLRNRRSAR